MAGFGIHREYEDSSSDLIGTMYKSHPEKKKKKTGVCEIRTHGFQIDTPSFFFFFYTPADGEK